MQRSASPPCTGTYVLMAGATGEPLAVMDARTLTAWRTAAASALAASYLAREDAEHLVMVGAGALAPHLVRAHAAVRPIKRVTLWNRTRSRAVQAAFGLAVSGIETEVADDLEAAVRAADIVSCATLSRRAADPGRVAQAGRAPRSRRRLHADDARGRRRAVKRARLYVDTRAGALKEAGDIVQPLERGIIEAKRHPRRPVRAVPRHRQGPHRRGTDHAVQIGGHRDRGPGRREARLVWTT